jgi:hypothetical protein
MMTPYAELAGYRERDEAVGLRQMAGEVIRDLRRGKNSEHELVGSGRQWGGDDGMESEMKVPFRRKDGWQSLLDKPLACGLQNVVAGLFSRTPF